jgi:drug/metabolite transporter (DMT)-like permease
MMTVTLGLLALSAYFLWRRRAHWGWAAVMAALLIGIIIFVRDVDFASSLGVQL